MQRLSPRTTTGSEIFNPSCKRLASVAIQLLDDVAGLGERLISQSPMSSSDNFGPDHGTDKFQAVRFTKD